MTLDQRQTVEIDYTNHRGERRKRLVIPRDLFWGSTQFHNKEQWMLNAHDIEKNRSRTFAMKDIHSWRPSL